MPTRAPPLPATPGPIPGRTVPRLRVTTLLLT